MARIFLSAPDISGRERELVAEAFDSNYVAPAGPMIERFEKAVCKYTGIGHAVAVSSGTAALHLAMRIAGIEKGDEVWTSSMTFIGGVSPIEFLGGTPVFFDLSPDSWTINCDLVEEELIKAKKNGKLPKAIVPTDLYGQSCDLDMLLKLGDQFGVKIITDAAESLGALYKSRHAGKGAYAAIFSFNGNKMISTSGGGMLVSDDKKLIDQARYLSTQARQPVLHFEHRDIGYNYRMSNICAAIGVGQLEQIEQKIEKRRDHFDAYKTALSRFSAIEFMPEPHHCRSTRWLTCMTIDPREGVNAQDLINACDLADIEVRPLWKPMHLQPVFKGAKFVGPGLCEKLFQNGLCLPSGSGMTKAERSTVVDVISRRLEAH